MSRGPRRRRRAPVRKRQSPVRMFAAVAATLAAFILVASIWVVWSYTGPGPKAKAGSATTVVLERGDSVVGIAKTLVKAGVIGSRDAFVLAAKFSGAASRLKAGEYEFRSRTPMGQVLADIRAGKVVRHLVSVPEGWTSQMAADAVAKAPELTGEAVAPPEGAILPDTYLVQRGEDRGAVIARMTQAQTRLLDQLWAARTPDLQLKTPEEAVILASIVEKETGLASERPRIAAVFLNRMRAGMRLESDPTIIYGISKGRPLGRGLTVSEIRDATPYNTYVIYGLPPTPIANPGRASLAAVLNPPKSTELFFVANGTGGHVFAATYAEHVANVEKWRAYERQAAKK